MLTKEVAETRLKAFFACGEEEKKTNGASRFQKQFDALPAKLREIAINQRERNVTDESYSESHTRQAKAFAAFDELTPQQRVTILSICFPKMARQVETAWRFLCGFPYQTGYQKTGFRLPQEPNASLEARSKWLLALYRIAEKFKEQLLTPDWLATWAPYIKTQWSGEESEIGMLLASVMNENGKEGDGVFAILRDSLLNQHEIGAMGRHVLCGFLMSSREEGWELVEKMLIAAQRQEGLRQAILESIDLANLAAFRRMLRLLIDQELARFSSVARAVDVWFGLAWDSASVKTINAEIERALRFLEDRATATAALLGDDPESAATALWAMAMEDGARSFEAARELLNRPSPEMRFVAVRHLERLQWEPATSLKWQASDDADIRVASRAVARTYVYTSSGAHTFTPPDAFERLERFLARFKEKSIELKPIVWPWTARTLERGSVADDLESVCQNPIPPTALIPYMGMMSSPSKKRVIMRFAIHQEWNFQTRETVIEAALDASQDVRSVSFITLKSFELSESELARLRSALTRKAPDLRLGVIEAILRKDDASSLASIDDLLNAKDANQRMAGLELARRMIDANRSIDECRRRAEEFAERRKCSKDEKAQLDAILTCKSKAPRLSLDNALGLLNPMKKTPVVAPPSIRVELLTPEVKAYAQALDELIHEHREKPIQPYGFSKEIRPLGALQWGFPAPNVRERPEKEIKRLPYSEIWLAWRDAQMKKAGADKGFWCLRAAACQAISGWGTNAHKEWAKKNVERQRLDQVLSQSEISGLQYPAIVRHLLRWFLFLHPADQNADLLLDAATMFASLVPAESFHDTLPQVEPQPKPSYYYYGAYQHDERAPWRGDSGPIRACLRLLGDLGSPLSKPQAERRWRLQRWLDEPTEGATRSRPSNADLIAAYRQGVANFDDFADALLGPRARRNSYSYLSDFGLFRELTARRPSPECRQLLADHPEVRSLVEQAIDKIADTELTRGETPTAATDPAQDIGAIYGTARLIQFLAAIGKSGFKISSGWRSEASLQRITTLTHLASVTYPRQEDSPEQFANLMRAEIEEKNFPEDRLIELAFLAPQWSKYVQHYFGWKGMAEALYWYLAHMNFMWGATTGENAAESAGLAELKKPEETAAAESADTESADIGDEEGAKAPKVEILTPWEQLVRERTSLTRAERDDGAIDVNWFHRVYKEIGPKRWERLAKAAKFAANAAQAKKASLIASVLLGEADLKELIAGIEKRYLKDNVRLLGLFPLPKGGKRDAELAIRHKVLTEYGRYAKQLSGLTKPAALRALEIGLKNLASTAGFEDALRLDWALGASQWADLAKGPVKVSKEGAEVMLAIDEQAAPIVTVTRNGKELKTAPAAVKKDPKVALLYERAKELRRQSSRQKQSLEAAMLRGDEFSAGELVQLCEHALVAPFLTRLVLVGDGVMGYPDKGGRALRDHAGKLEPVKKGETLRIAHPHDLFASGDWAQWQRDCFAMERVQPFKQVFRELYLATSQEKADGYQSHRYAGQQVQPRQAAALLGARAWNTGEGVFKVFHREDIVAWLLTNSGVTTPLEVEGWTIESVHFAKRGQSKPISMADVPARIFSEVMRDVDLVVSVAHRGGVDPEASASTVEMRASLLRETCQLLGLTNVRVQEQYAFIDGFHANYSLHLGSGSIHRLPGGYLCVVPVHSQHRGRLFLPFADDDPRTAEVISKLLLLARDQEISDPSILDQLRAF